MTRWSGPRPRRPGDEHCRARGAWPAGAVGGDGSAAGGDPVAGAGVRAVYRAGGAGGIGGQQQVTTVRALVSHGGCWPAGGTTPVPAHSQRRQPSGLEDLTSHQRELAGIRYAHLMEVEYGYRSGSALHARPGEPRPGYDPQTTTVTGRRHAKVAEIEGTGIDEARMLGLDHLSVRALRPGQRPLRGVAAAATRRGRASPVRPLSRNPPHGMKATIR
jgi:hypothetical protein